MTEYTVRSWVAAGELEAINVGGQLTARKLRFTEKSVASFLEARTE